MRGSLKTWVMIMGFLLSLLPFTTPASAAIFDGSGGRTGLCVTTPGAPECANIDCDNVAHLYNPLCLSGDTEKIGLCIGLPPLPVECSGIDCANPAVFNSDIRCISESQAGTGITKKTLDPTGLTHTKNFGDLIIKFVNFSLPYLVLAAFLGFITAGFFYVTAFGNEEQIEKAKRIMIWSVVGILIVIASYAIVEFFTTGLLGRL